MEIMSVILSFISAVFAGWAVLQNLDARRAKIAVRFGHDDLPGPGEWDGANYTVSAVNKGLVPVKIVDLVVIVPGIGPVTLKTHGFLNGNVLPKLLAPGDDFEFGFSHEELVEHDGVSCAGARVRIVVAGGDWFESSPLDKRLG